jgi:Predicted membrane protein (DUF2207) C-terminal domain
MTYVVASGLLVALVSVYLALIAHLRGGLRDAPVVSDPGQVRVSPAVAGWLLRGFRSHVDDFVATLLDLVSRGVVDLGIASDEAASGWLDIAGLPEVVVETGDFVVVARRKSADELASHEEVLLDLVFVYVGKGREVVSLRAVRHYAHAHGAPYASALQVFAGAVERAAAEAHIYRPQSRALWLVFTPLALALGLAGTLLTEWIYMFIGVILGIGFIVDARRAVVPGPTARDAYRACLGLRRYLRDVGRMGKKPVASVEVWGA